MTAGLVTVKLPNTYILGIYFSSFESFLHLALSHTTALLTESREVFPPTKNIHLSTAVLISVLSLLFLISYSDIQPGCQCRPVTTLKMQSETQWENDQNEERERKGSKGCLNMWAAGEIN